MKILVLIIFQIFLINSFGILRAQADLIQRWSNVENEAEGIKLSKELSKKFQYQNQEKKDSILRMLEQKSDSQLKKVLSYYVQSYFLAADSKYKNALIVLDSACAITENPYLYGELLIRKCGIQIIDNNHELVLEDLDLASKIAEEINDDYMLCEILLTKAELDRVLARKEEALDKLNQAIKIVEENNWEDDIIHIRILDRYASIYSMVGESEKAKSYSFQALELADRLNDFHSMAVSHNELGFIYEHQVLRDSAIHHYKKAVNIWSQLGSKAYTSNALGNLGRVYERMGIRDSAEYYLLWAHRLIRNTTWYYTKISVYGNLSINYYHQGDSILFYKYQCMEYAAQYQLTENSIRDDIVKYERQFEQSENERIIERQESEIEIKNAEGELRKRRADQFLTLMIIAICALIGASFWLRQTIKNRKKISRINTDLQAAIEVKEGLLKEIHHRVKNNLQMISGLLNIQAKNTSDENAKRALLESKSRLKAVSLVHKRLYIGEGYNKIDISVFLQDVVGQYVHSEMRTQDVFELRHDNFNIHIEQAVPLGFVLHELVTNSFKHAWEESEDKKIQLKMEVDNEYLIVNYADNGKGIGNVDIENASSLGVKLIRLFIVNQLKGEFEYLGNSGLNIQFRFKLRRTE